MQAAIWVHLGDLRDLPRAPGRVHRCSLAPDLETVDIPVQRSSRTQELRRRRILKLGARHAPTTGSLSKPGTCFHSAS